MWGDHTHAVWRPHGGEHWLLIYVNDGTARFTGPSGVRQARPGDAVLYAPRETQDYGGPEEWVGHYYWVYFTPRPHWLKWLHWPQDHLGLRCVHLLEGTLREQFSRAMDQMVEVWYRPMEAASDLAMSFLESALIWADVAKSSSTSVPTDLRVVQAIEYLNSHLALPYAPHLLAKHCNISVSRLEHLFTLHTGNPLRRYLEQLRVQRARYLLQQSQLSIGEIAVAVGYNDPAYFTSRFCRSIGQTPSEFRRASRPSLGMQPPNSSPNPD
jgi:AraC family transcriptional regulator of arabinose operon